MAVLVQAEAVSQAMGPTSASNAPARTQGKIIWCDISSLTQLDGHLCVPIIGKALRERK